DMGQIMLSYGAYNAMHLDGGGSSTMVVQDSGTGDYQVVNNLSDGVQRKVMNAFGVFSSAPQGGIAQIVVQPAVTNAFKGIPFSVDVYGLDAYYHRIDLDPAQFALTTDDPAGVWNGDGTYTPGTAGTITFTATYQDVGMSLDTALTGTAAVGCETLEQLDCNTGTIKTVVGGKTALTFTGMGGSGNRIPVTSGVTYEVSPASIGHMDGGTFVADASGVGSIKCAAAGIPAYVAVYSGGTEAPAYNFDGNKQLQFNSYPDGVTGSAQYTASTHTADADSSAELDYDFPVNDSTQAAYMDFTDPITFADTVTALKMWVSGDGNGYWLRGRLTDADGDQFTIDFAKTVDWTGWKQLTAAVPSGLTYPVVLDRIYIASLNNTQEVAGKLYFDGMTAVSPIKGEVTLPDTPKYTDDMRADLSGAPGSAQDITAVGNATWTDGTDDGTLPQNYDAVRAAVLASLERDCGRGLYMGDTGYDYKLDGFSAYQWNTGYCMHRISNTAVLQMTAAKGGILASNPDQWAKFSPDVAAMNPDNIIVELDINPLDNWSKEFDLFQQALAGYVSAGKNVFVVSHDGYDTSVSSKDGVRYINLGSLWNADGTRNPDFRVLRFRVDGKNITYDLEKAW
ncbi:MAG: phosphodiester glycosidase family protein, partial [Defluviitaleaceae bacterium]|nr:phosphodiester glycosidase family protein [Defluviitaleaceae bacterium]